MAGQDWQGACKHAKVVIHDLVKEENRGPQFWVWLVFSATLVIKSTQYGNDLAGLLDDSIAGCHADRMTV